MFMGISFLEWLANIMTAICIVLAGRNNIHTWWTGIVACVLFGMLFFQSNLYADVTLQLFFIITSIFGWYNWQASQTHQKIKSINNTELITYVLLATGVAILYGLVLKLFTNAFAPFVDSMVLTFSILGQLLLMTRYWQNWPFWVFVNTLSVPLYISRELYLTAGMYTFFWINALVSWKHWLKLYKAQ